MLQLVVSGLIIGSLYALIGVSWGLIYSTTRTFHFAHGLTFTMLPMGCSFLLRRLTSHFQFHLS